MPTDRQVRWLWKLLSAGRPLSRSARMCDMDEKTARKYRESRRLPSELAQPRTHRTRTDPFAEVWEEVREQLSLTPELQAKALFEHLQRKYPGRFQDGQLRTFQRGVKRWRATAGPAREVFFDQVHHPGDLCSSDFTHLSSLRVTLGGQPFEHLVYHFVLTYSNWESATICFSESLESLSEGLQNALWELGGVPVRHRSDRMSAAVNNLSDGKEFRQRYEALLEHCGLRGEKINARKAHENGDVESSHRHFKVAVEQALLLRGSREFADRVAYAAFLRTIVAQRNAGRTERLAQELPLLRALPPRRREACRRIRVRVSRGSIIRVQNNTYSVPSRLIGEQVEVRIYAEHLEVWLGDRRAERLPRLRGRSKSHVHYRHVIEHLVRKPGAFLNYRYRESMFPTTRFRIAFDGLEASCPSRSVKEYLRILQLAAEEGETRVDDALRSLLEAESPLTSAAVEAFVRSAEAASCPTAAGRVAPPDLASFDALLSDGLLTDTLPIDKEVCDARMPGCESDVGGAVEGVASAVGAGELRGVGSAGGVGVAELRAVPAGVGGAGMPDAAREPDCAAPATIEPAAGEGSSELRSEASADEGSAELSDAAGRNVSGPPREPPGVR